MQKFRMQIPDEVVERAAKAQYEWQDGLPSWETDADGFTKAEYVGQTQAAAQVIAEWARKEALREAAADPALRLSGHSGISIRKLRALAEQEQ